MSELVQTYAQGSYLLFGLLAGGVFLAWILMVCIIGSTIDSFFNEDYREGKW